MVINKKIIEIIKNGGVGVMPTDTIYGIVASVTFPDSLVRIYTAKGRPEKKKLIHLVGNTKQLADLGVQLSESQLIALQSIWPGPVSVEFDCDDSLPYLHRGTYCIAVRMPDKVWLRDLVSSTGPIVATSANKSGLPTPNTISEIRTQLPGLDFYLEGPTGSTPSRLARIERDGTVEWLERS